MPQMLEAIGIWPLFLVTLVIWGFAPGLVLRLITCLLHPDDPRRRELLAELPYVPRLERPYWVAEQLELGLREGLVPRSLWWINARFLRRARLESGVARNLSHPESFEIPSAVEKDSLRPGDSVKLIWSVVRAPGERMWVEITHREGNRFEGSLRNDPLFVHAAFGDVVTFEGDHIIDIVRASESPAEGAP